MLGIPSLLLLLALKLLLLQPHHLLLVLIALELAGHPHELAGEALAFSQI
jgi:hypothetical protein